MRRYPLYIFDLDGTLFRGNEAIEGAPEALARLRVAGSKIRYLTNNSGQTRVDYLEKLGRLGFEAHPEEIYSSAIGVAHTLAEHGHKTAFVVGEPGFHETLRDAGIEVVEEHAEAVAVGMCRTFSYELLNRALQNCIQGAKLYASNTDATYPLEGGRVSPGAGSIVAAVATASGQEPFVVGKPNPYLVNLILRDADCPPQDALAVGDRFETDILAGKNAGTPTLLVMTGVTTEPIEGQLTLPSVAAL
jgi:phosphoglycolate/pyridoxal phosphate phosphatase family enzyme